MFGNEGEGVWESGFMGVRGVGGEGVSNRLLPYICELGYNSS